MRTLYLLRHAEASQASEAVRDFDRPLTQRGRVVAKLAGRVLGSEGPKRFSVLCSAAVRARETAELMVSASGISSQMRFDDDIYEANLSGLLESIACFGDDKEVIVLVGHNPGMELLIRYLTNETRAMSAGALARIDLDITTWQEVGPGKGRLRWLMSPNDMRAI